MIESAVQIFQAWWTENCFFWCPEPSYPVCDYISEHLSTQLGKACLSVADSDMDGAMFGAGLLVSGVGIAGAAYYINRCKKSKKDTNLFTVVIEGSTYEDGRDVYSSSESDTFFPKQTLLNAWLKAEPKKAESKVRYKALVQNTDKRQDAQAEALAEIFFDQALNKPEAIEIGCDDGSSYAYITTPEGQRFDMTQLVHQVARDGVLYRGSDSKELKAAMTVLYNAVCDQYGISSDLGAVFKPSVHTI